jgi:hypothetical protein
MRLRSDCIVPYLTLAKSTRLPLLLCKIFNSAGAPKRTVGSLRCSSSRTCEHACEGLRLRSPRPDEAILSPSQVLEEEHRSYGTVRLAKSKILVQMSISLFSKSYGKSLQKFF